MTSLMWSCVPPFADGAGSEPAGLGHKGSIKQHHLLVQLLRLRQICCHPALAKTVRCGPPGTADLVRLVRYA